MKKCFIAVVFAAFGIVNAQEAVAPTEPAIEAPAAVHLPAAEPTAQAPVATPVTAEAADSSIVVMLVEEKPKKKKKRGTSAPKNEFAVVDVPANFEIQARKVMPVDAEGWGSNNLDSWWGRANLMVLTESENFVGKLHLRMYPGEFSEKKTFTYNSKGERDGHGDYFQLYEAWAWHRGDYVNIKIGRWDNTIRFGSKTFGGYVDAKKDKYVLTDSEKEELGKLLSDAGKCGSSACVKNYIDERNKSRRISGFLSTYEPENMVQFGLHNFSENMSLDLALISSDENLNKGDLRAYFRFKDLAGIENMEFGLGYRSNVFDGIYDKTTDVTHTASFAFRMPVVNDVGILKSLILFAETALIGLDDQTGSVTRTDGGKMQNQTNPALPVLGGLDISLFRGLDKIVIEAEYDSNRRNKTPCEAGDIKCFSKIGSEENVRDVQGSIFVQKALNDRFTLNLGVQSEHNTKDFSLAARLQGRIN